MKKALTWMATLTAAAGIVAGLYLVYREGRKERALEAYRERPISAQPKVFRTKEGDLAVSLSPEDRKRLGITLLALRETAEPQEITGYGLVLSPASIVSLQRDLVSSEVSLAAYRSEYERLSALYLEGENASRRALEAAEAQLRSEESRARAASRQLATEWGDAFLSVPPAEREAFLDRLAKRETVFVRVNLLPGESPHARPAGARLVVLGDEERPIATDRVYDAPDVDPKTQGRGFLLRVDLPEPGLRPGAAVIAYLRLPGDPLKGVVIPRAAVIRLAGKSWAYAKLDDSRFTRREVTLDRPAAQGWFSRSGLKPGDEIVVEGAQMLLSEELKPQIQVMAD